MNSVNMDDQMAYLVEMMSLSNITPKRDLANERLSSRHDAVMSDSSDSEDSTYAPSQPVSLNPANSPEPTVSTSTYPPSPYPVVPSTNSQPTHPTPPLPTPPASRDPSGCGYLQHIHTQLQSGQYNTTGGDYLETIFTHREALFAYPHAHRTCSLGFVDLAGLLEAREWRADREGDSEAVAAFRHEAVMVGSWTGF
ncbi:hypothetical protein QCA50_005197 [Cerrena zonata]|uniref:Uncharacterized protein n=1 Tax=Cerrena zonata TaxID=2478898 RepID=A0AAW0GQF7_9APHY